MRALLTSLGACTGMDVAAFLRKQKLTSLKILPSGEQPAHSFPKPWQTINVKCVVAGENLERKYVAQAINDSSTKFCSVAATLRPEAKISYSYEIKC